MTGLLFACVRKAIVSERRRRTLMMMEAVGQILDPADIIVVPDYSPFELASLARKTLSLTAFDTTFLRWHFIRGSSGRVVEVRARRFEIVTWSPRQRIETQEVWDKFLALNASGNTGVFISWITQRKPSGYFASIPPEDFRYRDPNTKSDQMRIPYFYNDCGNCILTIENVSGTWSDDWTFFACRELESLAPTTIRF